MISEGLMQAEKAGRKEQQRSAVTLLTCTTPQQVVDAKALPSGGWGSPAQAWLQPPRCPISRVG